MSLKNYFTRVMVVLLLLGVTQAKAQTITIIDAPAGYDGLFAGFDLFYATIEEANYWRIIDNSGTHTVAKVEGTTVTTYDIPVQYQGSGLGTTETHFQIGNEIFFIGQKNGSDHGLLKIDGDSLIDIPAPAGLTQVLSPIHTEGDTAFLMVGDNTQYGQIAKFDGTTLTLVPFPSGYASNGSNGAYDYAIPFNGDLFFLAKSNSGNGRLLKYMGGNLTEIPMPSSHANGFGVEENDTTQVLRLGGALYFKSRNNSSINEMLHFDGSTLTAIPDQHGQFHLIGNGFQYVLGKIGNDGFVWYRHLGGQFLYKINGTTQTVVNLPAAVGALQSAQKFGDRLFFRHHNGGSTKLTIFDGTSFVEIDTPPAVDVNSGGFQFVIGQIDSTYYLSYKGHPGSNHFLYTLKDTTVTEVDVNGTFTSGSTGLNVGYPAQSVTFNDHYFFPYLENVGTNSLKIHTSGVDSLADVDLPSPYIGLTDANDFVNAVAFNNSLHVPVFELSGNSDLMIFAPCKTPSDMVASNLTETSASLTWTPSPDALTYKVRWKTPGNPGWSSMFLPGSTDSLAAAGLTADTRYHYTIQSRCAHGWGNISARTKFRTTNGPCEEPTGLTALNVQATKAKLGWTADSNAVKVQLRHRMVGDSVWSQKTIDVNRTHFWINGLTLSTSYEWQMKTICSFSGNYTSDWTTMEQFTTQSFKTAADHLNFSSAEEQVNVFPNPSQGVLHINGLDGLNQVSLYLFDNTGRLVLSQENTKEAQLSWQLDHLPAGLYFLRVQSEEGMLNQKLILQ